MYASLSTVFILLFTSFGHTKYIEGEINVNDNWVFLARFCFLSDEGQFEYLFEFNEDQGVPNLLLYFDTDDQWPAVYKSNKNCYEKEAALHVELHQIINMSATNQYLSAISSCIIKPSGVHTTTGPTTASSKRSVKPQSLVNSTTVETTTLELPTTVSTWDSTTDRIASESTLFIGESKGDRTVLCHSYRKFRSVKERWWFMALSNCNGTRGIKIKYKLTMTNGPPGDYWHEHFSADKFYILPVLIAFSIANSFLTLGVIICCSIKLKSGESLLSTYKIFIVSVIFQLFGIILTSAAYLKYAIDGLDLSKIKRVGTVLMGLSETLFLLLLLLLAKGFTITRERLPLASSVKLTIFMCLYVVAYISILIYEANVFDPGEVLYLYESPAGYGLLILRMLAWAVFIYSTVFILRDYSEKSNFYYPFSVCGTIWFIAGPIFILSANSNIDKLIRESVVGAVLYFINFGGHLIVLIMYQGLKELR